MRSFFCMPSLSLKVLLNNATLLDYHFVIKVLSWREMKWREKFQR